MFISGDRHLAEISKLPTSVADYPLYEVTDSGLNSAMGKNAYFSGKPNRHRVNDISFDDIFGAISIQKKSNNHQLTLPIYHANGKQAEHIIIDLEDLTF